MSNPTATTAYFCTYKNRETKGWQKSREYSTMKEMMHAMLSYIEAHPVTTVQFQTRIVYI